MYIKKNNNNNIYFNIIMYKYKIWLYINLVL